MSPRALLGGRDSHTLSLIHTHRRTHTLAHTQTHIHTLTHTRTYTHIHTHTLTHTYTFTYTYTHTYTQSSHPSHNQTQPPPTPYCLTPSPEASPISHPRTHHHKHTCVHTHIHTVFVKNWVGFPAPHSTSLWLKSLWSETLCSLSGPPGDVVNCTDGNRSPCNGLEGFGTAESEPRAGRPLANVWPSGFQSGGFSIRGVSASTLPLLPSKQFCLSELWDMVSLEKSDFFSRQKGVKRH